MRMKRINYKFVPGRFEARAEFGEPNSTMEDFIDELFRSVADNDSAGEER